MKLRTIDSTDDASEAPRRRAAQSDKPTHPATRIPAKKRSSARAIPAVSRETADEMLTSMWEERARLDGPVAFRAIVRAFVEGAEGSGDEPDQKAAAILFAWTAAENAADLAPALGILMKTVHQDAWSTALIASSSGTFMAAYRAAFVDAYQAATVDFRDAGAVGDYLGEPTPDETRWRGALYALWVTPSDSAAVTGPQQSLGAPTYVVFHYCVSLGIVTFKRSSGVKVIPLGGSRFLAGLPYTLISFFAGWWGIPWGPLWTLEAIFRNLKGGTDVTDLVGGGKSVAGLPGLPRGTDATSLEETLEPNLSADMLDRYRELPRQEQMRLLRAAEKSAAESVAIGPTRDYAAERDAYIELELNGFHEKLSESLKAEFTNPGDWRRNWEVVVGQDDPPKGRWGWMIIQAHIWPPIQILRVPVAFATEAEARSAGEAAAEKYWVEVNEQLAAGMEQGAPA